MLFQCLGGVRGSTTRGGTGFLGDARAREADTESRIEEQAAGHLDIGCEILLNTPCILLAFFLARQFSLKNFGARHLKQMFS